MHLTYPQKIKKKVMCVHVCMCCVYASVHMSVRVCVYLYMREIENMQNLS